MLADHPMTEDISDWQEQGWSAKLISSWLTEQFPGDKLCQVSPETICQCLYVQTRGSLRADLWKQLSTKRAARKPRERVERRSNSHAEAFAIAQQPPETTVPCRTGSPKAPTSAFTPKPTCTGSRTCSTADPDPLDLQTRPSASPSSSSKQPDVALAA
jgi:IS30 family transposase